TRCRGAPLWLLGYVGDRTSFCLHGAARSNSAFFPGTTCLKSFTPFSRGRCFWVEMSFVGAKLEGFLPFIHLSRLDSFTPSFTVFFLNSFLFLPISFPTTVMLFSASRRRGFSAAAGAYFFC